MYSALACRQLISLSVGHRENLRDQVIPALLLKHEMKMGRTPAVSAQMVQQLSYRSVVRDGIADGFDTLEPESPIVVRHHDAPLARLRSSLVLHVIMPAAVRFPDVDLDPRHRVSLAVLDCANHQQRLAFGISRHVRAVLQRRRIVRVERAQDGALGRVGRLGVVDAVDEQGEAENIGEENEFLA